MEAQVLQPGQPDPGAAFPYGHQGLVAVVGSQSAVLALH